MNISKFRLTQNRVQAAIQSFAKSSSNIVFLPELEKRSMAGMMNFHQAMKCLQSGTIVGKPVLNEHGDWEAVMERYAANNVCRIKVIAQCDGVDVKLLIVTTEK